MNLCVHQGRNFLHLFLTALWCTRGMAVLITVNWELCSWLQSLHNGGWTLHKNCMNLYQSKKQLLYHLCFHHIQTTLHSLKFSTLLENPISSIQWQSSSSFQHSHYWFIILSYNLTFSHSPYMTKLPSHIPFMVLTMCLIHIYSLCSIYIHSAFTHSGHYLFLLVTHTS